MLLYLRVLVPGLMLIAGFYPFYYKEKLFDSPVDFNYVILLAILVGSIYYVSPLQYKMVKGTLAKINANILSELISIYNSKNLGNPVGTTKKEELLKDKNSRYLHVFYHIVDNDESLKSKASISYFYSIFWSATADSVLINALATIAYCILALGRDMTYTPFIYLFFAAMLLSLILNRYSVGKHMWNSNQQLDFIRLYHADKVSKELAMIL